MRSPRNLRAWIRQLLPTAGPCAQAAAWQLVHALLIQFTTHLTQLARQTDRPATAKSSRQYLARWLSRSHWEPQALYAQLNRGARRLLGRKGTVALLVDFTYLGNAWAVLQVSFPWRGRALPLYRGVYRRTDPDLGQTAAVLAALAFLHLHLPGPWSRYVLVMDRGFPSHPLIRRLQEQGWRFVLRVNGTWKMTHPEFTGLLREAAPLAGPGAVAQRFPAAILGQRHTWRERWSQVDVVIYQGAGQQEPWLLVTTEARASAAVALYRQRMRIEAEFRDLKGPWGLDELAHWQDGERVARFLALVAVYEWRLAYLWRVHRLQEWRPRLTVQGKLSWIRITREWFQFQMRLLSQEALACL